MVKRNCLTKEEIREVMHEEYINWWANRAYGIIFGGLFGAGISLIIGMGGILIFTLAGADFNMLMAISPFRIAGVGAIGGAVIGLIGFGSFVK